MSDPYMILNATMYYTDLYSCRGTNVGSSIEHLLRSKWEKLSTQDDVDKAIEYFAIYDIFDNTRAMYQFLENGFTFRYINDRCEESD